MRDVEKKRKYMRAYRCVEKNQEAKRVSSLRYRARWREALFVFMGGCCERCRNNDLRVLQIDHVNGGGRRANTGAAYYRRVMLSVLRGEKKFSLLCANDNWIKRSEKGET